MDSRLTKKTISLRKHSETGEEYYSAQYEYENQDDNRLVIPTNLGHGKPLTLDEQLLVLNRICDIYRKNSDLKIEEGHEFIIDGSLSIITETN